MGNSVLTAKQAADKNFCELSDVEVVFKGVEDVYTVDENGEAGYLKETYGDESAPAYYYCHGCERDWAVTAVQSIEQCWVLVKEHLDE